MEAQVGVLEAGALRGEVADEHTLAHEVREQRGRGGPAYGRGYGPRPYYGRPGYGPRPYYGRPGYGPPPGYGYRRYDRY